MTDDTERPRPRRTAKRRAKPTPAPIATPTGGARADGQIGTTVRIPPRFHRAVRRLAIDLEEELGREVTLRELVLDGLGLVFAKHGRPVPPLDE